MGDRSMHFVNAATKAVLMGVMLVAFGASVAFAVETKTDRAATDTAPAKVPPAWVATCSNLNPEGELHCKIEQSLFVAKTRQRIVGVTLEANRENSKFVNVRVQLPHGIKLPSGLKLWVDEGKRRAVDISYADADGSYAAFPIDGTMVSELMKGQVLRLLVESIAGKPTIVELKLDGFAKSFKFLEDFK
jgi:invasion protein IalB